MSHHAHLGSFYVPWSAAVASASGISARVDGTFVILDIGGFELPVIRLALAVLGVLGARYVAPRGAQPGGRATAAVITLLMLLIAASWVIEARPGMLMTVVVSLGLGFSGYALLELAGREIEAFVSRVFATASAFLDRIGKPK